MAWTWRWNDRCSGVGADPSGHGCQGDERALLQDNADPGPLGPTGSPAGRDPPGRDGVLLSGRNPPRWCSAFPRSLDVESKTRTLWRQTRRTAETPTAVIDAEATALITRRQSQKERPTISCDRGPRRSVS